MQQIEQAYKAAADLYSTAFLLTGRSELSLELTLEILDVEDDPEFFSSNRTQAKLRRRVVEKALAAIREELAASQHQPASCPLMEVYLPPSTWSLDPNTTRLQIESALLAIDAFPRCVLLLTLLEGLSLGEAAALLGRDVDSILQGRMAGLWSFTHHLARQQGWSPSVLPFPQASFEADVRSRWSES